MFSVPAQVGGSRQAQAAAQPAGYSVEAVMVERIIQGAAHDASILPSAGVEYPIYTPYGNEAAAAIMLNAAESESVDDTIDEDDSCTIAVLPSGNTPGCTDNL